jgi:hypothetical protein
MPLIAWQSHHGQINGLEDRWFWPPCSDEMARQTSFFTVLAPFAVEGRWVITTIGRMPLALPE